MNNFNVVLTIFIIIIIIVFNTPNSNINEHMTAKTLDKQKLQSIIKRIVYNNTNTTLYKSINTYILNTPILNHNQLVTKIQQILKTNRAGMINYLNKKIRREISLYNSGTLVGIIKKNIIKNYTYNDTNFQDILRTYLKVFNSRSHLLNNSKNIATEIIDTLTNKNNSSIIYTQIDKASVDTTSVDTTSADTTSADTTSADTTSADTTSANTTSVDTTSANTTSADTTSANTT